MVGLRSGDGAHPGGKERIRSSADSNIPIRQTAEAPVRLTITIPLMFLLAVALTSSWGGELRNIS
jgi:hypothetical protein